MDISITLSLALILERFELFLNYFSSHTLEAPKSPEGWFRVICLVSYSEYVGFYAKHLVAHWGR